MGQLFKLGGKGKTFREQAALPGAWRGKVRLGAYQHQRVTLCDDAEVSRSWLRELQNAANRKWQGEPIPMDRLTNIRRDLLEKLGLVNKLAQTRRKNWDQHIEDYCSELSTRGLSSKYVVNAKRYLKEVGKSCQWSGLNDVDRDELQAFIEKRKAADTGARAVNNIRATVIAFMTWAVKVRRADRNDLITVARIDASTDRRRERRSLSQEECIKLLAASPKRELLYRLGLATGLRLRELRLLQWRDVRIDAADSARPFLALRAEATKSKRPDEVPL